MEIREITIPVNGRPSKYNFGDLVVGGGCMDCGEYSAALANSVRTSAISWVKRRGIAAKFSVRKFEDKGVARCGCWRVE